MKIMSNDLNQISQSKSVRMGVAYTKESHAPFLLRYASCCNNRLKDICTIRKGSVITENDAEAGDIPVVAGGRDFAYYHNVSNRTGGSITVSASGAYSGYVNYWPKPIWASDCTTIQSLNENVYITKYIYHLLCLVQDDIFLLQKGTDQPHVYPDDIECLRVPSIAIDTQRKALDKISAIEDSIASFKEQIKSVQDVIDLVFQREFGFDYDKFEELKKGRIYSAGQELFSNNPDLRFSVKYHRPAGNFVRDELRRLTDKKIKHFLAEPIVLGASISPNDFDECGTAYYVSMATIKTLNVVLDETQLVSPAYYESKKRKSLKKGDIIIARSGVAIGKTALVEEEFDGIFADFTMRIRFDSTKYNPRFAYYYMRSRYFQYLIEISKKGLQNQNIFPGVLQEFPLVDISLSEQQRIVDEIYAEIMQQDLIKKDIENLESQIHEIMVKSIQI